MISAVYPTIAYSISGLPRSLFWFSSFLLPAIFWEWGRKEARDEPDSVLPLFNGDTKNKSMEKVKKAVKPHLFEVL